MFLPLASDDLDEAFLGEVTAERYGELSKKVRGKYRLVRDWYVPSKLKNDWGDVLKMSRVVWTLISKATVA